MIYVVLSGAVLSFYILLRARLAWRRALAAKFIFDFLIVYMAILGGMPTEAQEGVSLGQALLLILGMMFSSGILATYFMQLKINGQKDS
jgi:drug/metabolite transporter (DMT)-like permease